MTKREMIETNLHALGGIYEGARVRYVRREGYYVDLQSGGILFFEIAADADRFVERRRADLRASKPGAITIIEPTDPAIQSIRVSQELFKNLTEIALLQVATSSARIYAQTYRAWVKWCDENNVSRSDYFPAKVLRFITGQDTTKTTRQRQLSAMRQLAKVQYSLSSHEPDRQIFEALKMIKLGADQEKGSTRTKKRLSPAETDRALRAWSGDSLLSVRNRALLATLAFTGMRRAECAALQWRDIDFQNGVVTIRHGKGDKRRESPICGGNTALDALRHWQMAQLSDRVYVFCPVRKGDKLGDDKPIDGKDVYRVIQATAKAAGVTFKPHDLRRTFITEGLETGSPVHTIQMAAGHKKPSTTLGYAEAVSAREARKTIRLRYGD